MDFLVIGALKSGTTSLFHYLRNHPQIYVPPEKEVPFFSNEKRFAIGWDSYFREFFSEAPADAILGTVTPQYMERPSSFVPQRIFQLMPRIKLIALLRNPIDRAFSHYRMESRFNREPRKFEEAAASDLGKEKLKIYFTAGQYGAMLDQFLDYFPREQLLVHFTDALEETPEKVLDSIMAHLGLATGFRPLNLGKRYHVGGRQRFPVLVPFVKKITPLKRLYRTLPLSSRRVIWGWVTNEGNVKRETAPPLDPAVRLQLRDFYLPDIVRMESLLGKKVPWKEFRSF